MASITTKYFSAVEYIKKLREANFTEAQADIVVEIIEQQAQAILEQSTKLTQLESKELATKSDIKDIELKIKSAEIRLMTLYGAGSLVLLGVLAKGFHWF